MNESNINNAIITIWEGIFPGYVSIVLQQIRL